MSGHLRSQTWSFADTKPPIRLHCLNRIRKVFYGATLEEMGGTQKNFTLHNGQQSLSSSSLKRPQAPSLTGSSRPLFPIPPSDANVPRRRRRDEHNGDARNSGLHSQLSGGQAVPRLRPHPPVGQRAARGAAGDHRWLEGPECQRASPTSCWPWLLNSNWLRLLS